MIRYIIRALERKRERDRHWDNLWLENQCNCTPHDITIPGAAHAVDCPKFD